MDDQRVWLYFDHEGRINVTVHHDGEANVLNRAGVELNGPGRHSAIDGKQCYCRYKWHCLNRDVLLADFQGRHRVVGQVVHWNVPWRNRKWVPIIGDREGEFAPHCEGLVESSDNHIGRNQFAGEYDGGRSHQSLSIYQRRVTKSETAIYDELESSVGCGGGHSDRDLEQQVGETGARQIADHGVAGQHIDVHILFGFEIDLAEVPIFLDHHARPSDGVHFKAFRYAPNIGQHIIGPNLYLILSVCSQDTVKLQHHCLHCINIRIDAIDTCLRDCYVIPTCVQVHTLWDGEVYVIKNIAADGRGCGEGGEGDH